jgi:pSer/pThr/pTyr-binding forkhead associated (FHA) protein
VLSCTVTTPARTPGTLCIGRAPDNDIVLDDREASRYHAELRKVAGGIRIVDLGSANGTFVNGRGVTDATLSEGDVVDIGSATFRLAGGKLQEFTDTSDLPGQTRPQPAPPQPPSPQQPVPQPPAPQPPAPSAMGDRPPAAPHGHRPR